MKTLVFILSLFLAGCSLDTEAPNIPVFDTPQDAIEWILYNIDGEMDSNIYSIEEIGERRKGGCTTFSGLFLYVLVEQFGEDARIVLTEENGYGHTIVLWDGTYYDLTDKENFIVGRPEKILGYWTLDQYYLMAKIK